MNWIRPDYPYAEVRLPKGYVGDFGLEQPPLQTKSRTIRDGDVVKTTVILTNSGAKPYFSVNGDIGVTLPLEDRYDLAEKQVINRCNVHLFCAGTASYVIALRMGGKAPHLGLVLTEGALSSYSVERDTALSSNDRGCFILNIAPFELQPGESTTLAWTIFPFTDMDDFYHEAGAHTQFIQAEWNKYVLFTGEKSTLTLAPSFSAQHVTVNGQKVQPDSDGKYLLHFEATDPGEKVFNIDADGHTLRTRIMVKIPFNMVLENRCRFIAENQQYNGPNNELKGAFLAYDNEDKHYFYNQYNDFNAGRERVGMGILLTHYLNAVSNKTIKTTSSDTESIIRSAVDRFAAYMRRELVDTPTGEAFNDFGRDGSFKRLYNAPWYAYFFLTLYDLDKNIDDALTAFRILKYFYSSGGTTFYPLELPVIDMCNALETAGLDGEFQEIKSLFLEHAKQIAKIGTNYPPHEVNYEQSIVSPAVVTLLQTYIVTKDESLWNAARPHIRAMEQFQGMQPDYHLNEVAIRHWDGYWFGKLAQYGDTFPHYWSGLTGNAFALLYQITGNERYARRAKGSLRGVLPMIFDDGTASCAYVFPHAINGVRSQGFDPYANDQDWGLMFALRQLSANPECPLL
jgi:hypothetical protein